LRIHTGHRLTSLIIFVVVILATQAVLLLVETRQIREAEVAQEKIGEQLLHLRRAWESLQDAESGQREFLLTGDDAFLEIYSRAIPEIETHLAEARRLFADNASALNKLSTIDSLRNRKLSELSDGIRLRGTVGQHAALAVIRSGVGKMVMIEMRGIFNSEMDAAQARRSEINRQIAAKIDFASYLLAGVSLVVLLIFGYVVTQLLRAFNLNAKLNHLLENQATRDALTGLPNRRLLMQWLEKTLAQAARGKLRVAVFYMDLDGFKQVNDQLGHNSGDAVLRAAADRFKKILRDADILARMGGDEFVVVLTNNPLKSDLRMVAQRLIDGLKREPLVRGLPEDAVGTSIGIALYPEHGTGVDALLAAADQAMYHAKQAGKRQFQFAVSNHHLPPEPAVSAPHPEK